MWLLSGTVVTHCVSEPIMRAWSTYRGTVAVVRLAVFSKLVLVATVKTRTLARDAD
jgi:hypothetical protein